MRARVKKKEELTFRGPSPINRTESQPISHSFSVYVRFLIQFILCFRFFVRALPGFCFQPLPVFYPANPAFGTG
jgi:hypothetical protein